MKIAIVQIYNDKIKSYAQYSQLVNSIYAIQHNYEYISWNYDLVPEEYSVFYNKILAICEVLKSNMNFDWVLYLDADAIITNNQIGIEEIIRRHENKEIIMGKDANGANNGVILVKNTTKMLNFLLDCYNDARFFHQKMPEQTAMFALLNEDKYKNLIGWETMHFFNAYLCYYADMLDHTTPLWDDQSFILHLQHIPNSKRELFLRQFLQQMHIRCLTKGDE